jgi:membrane dipeptidase
MKFQRLKQFMVKRNSVQGEMTDAQKDVLYKEWEEIQGLDSPDMPTVKDLCDHIDHVKNLVGVDYVGIGSDFDGGGGLRDCADVSQFPNITKELLRRGYTESEIRKIWGGNLVRVFREVENCAATSQK